MVIMVIVIMVIMVIMVIIVIMVIMTQSQNRKTSILLGVRRAVATKIIIC